MSAITRRRSVLTSRNPIGSEAVDEITPLLSLSTLRRANTVPSSSSHDPELLRSQSWPRAQSWLHRVGDSVKNVAHSAKEFCLPTPPSTAELNQVLSDWVELSRCSDHDEISAQVTNAARRHFDDVGWFSFAVTASDKVAKPRKRLLTVTTPPSNMRFKHILQHLDDGASGDGSLMSEFAGINTDLLAYQCGQMPCMAYARALGPAPPTWARVSSLLAKASDRIRERYDGAGASDEADTSTFPVAAATST